MTCPWCDHAGKTCALCLEGKLKKAREALYRAVDFCHEILAEHQPEGYLADRTREHLADLAEVLRR